MTVASHPCTSWCKKMPHLLTLSKFATRLYVSRARQMEAIFCIFWRQMEAIFSWTVTWRVQHSAAPGWRIWKVIYVRTKHRDKRYHSNSVWCKWVAWYCAIQLSDLTYVSIHVCSLRVHLHQLHVGLTEILTFLYMNSHCFFVVMFSSLSFTVGILVVKFTFYI